MPPELREYLSKLGRKGGLKGGHARAEKMSPEERSKSASVASNARWAKTRTPAAIAQRKRKKV